MRLTVWRWMVVGLLLFSGAAACDTNEGDTAKSDRADDDGGGKKKKKKKKKNDDDEPQASASVVAPPPPPPAAPSAAAPEPSAPPEPEEAKCGALSDIPDIPAEKSDPPKDLAEWNTGCEVNTQGANSHAPDCTAVLKREWLKVTCRGKQLGVEEMSGFGAEGSDYFKLFTPNQLISFVVRLRKGQSQKVRMCRPSQRASLFVSWPPSKEKPTIIAIGIGPKCDSM